MGVEVSHQYFVSNVRETKAGDIILRMILDHLGVVHRYRSGRDR